MCICWEVAGQMSSYKSPEKNDLQGWLVMLSFTAREKGVNAVILWKHWDDLSFKGWVTPRENLIFIHQVLGSIDSALDWKKLKLFKDFLPFHSKQSLERCLRTRRNLIKMCQNYELILIRGWISYFLVDKGELQPTRHLDILEWDNFHRAVTSSNKVNIYTEWACPAVVSCQDAVSNRVAAAPNVQQKVNYCANNSCMTTDKSDEIIHRPALEDIEQCFAISWIVFLVCIFWVDR